MSRISILLSTYNGEKYLKAQLDSLYSQSHQDFKLIVRDDGSTDRTKEILNSYNIKLIDSSENFGVKKSFEKLLKYASKNNEAKYFMFCDQDDVWNNDKIETTLKKMQELEKLYGNEIPILVHTDLEVVDKKLETLSDSMWKSEHINPKANTLNKLLIQNTITGCTIMINRNLAIKSLSISSKAIMHDWWIGLVATTFGKIGFIEESTMKYRQHGKNDTGAKTYDYKFIINKLKKLGDINVDKNISQAKEFLEDYKEELDEESKIILEDFSSIKEKPYLQRVNIILKYRLFKYGIIRNIGLLLKI
ncbi:MAG: glycosyltransferase family 2 protein [Aliarcobacter sp.]|nr:glycosyltransferase family 2 protein [Aliarcobacter sp.]